MKQWSLPQIKRISRLIIAIFSLSLISLLMLEGVVHWWGYAEHYIYDPVTPLAEPSLPASYPFILRFRDVAQANHIPF